MVGLKLYFTQEDLQNYVQNHLVHDDKKQYKDSELLIKSVELCRDNSIEINCYVAPKFDFERKLTDTPRQKININQFNNKKLNKERIN